MGWAGLSEDTEGTVGTGAVEVSSLEVWPGILSILTVPNFPNI